MSQEKSVVPATPRYAIGNRGSFFKRPALENDCTYADGIIFGCPFDTGCSYRVGARFGPQGVRQASQLIQYSYNPFQKAQMSNLKIYDGGDVPCTPYNIQNALDSIYKYTAALRKVSANVICVGGDHTISYSLLKAASEQAGKPISLLHFDTHLDTGNTYFDEPFTHGTPFRRAHEDGWIDTKKSFHIGCHGSLYSPAVLTDDANMGFEVITSENFVEMGAPKVAERIKNKVGDNPVYVSVDIDVLDPAFAPGTGTPEAGGLQTRELLHCIRLLNDMNHVGGDVVEVAPCYDHAEITSLAATAVLYEILTVGLKNKT